MTATKWTALRDRSPFGPPTEVLGQVVAEDREQAYQVGERLFGRPIVCVRASSWPAPAAEVQPSIRFAEPVTVRLASPDEEQRWAQNPGAVVLPRLGSSSPLGKAGTDKLPAEASQEEQPGDPFAFGSEGAP